MPFWLAKVWGLLCGDLACQMARAKIVDNPFESWKYFKKTRPILGGIQWIQLVGVVGEFSSKPCKHWYCGKWSR